MPPISMTDLARTTTSSDAPFTPATTALIAAAIRIRDDNSINATPLVVIPLLCTAIFAVIVIYTIRQERQYQDEVASGIRAPRSTSSWESTGAWVREVRGAQARSRRKKTQAGRKRRRRSSSSSSSTNGSQTTSDTSGDGSEMEERGRRLSTIEEEAENEVVTGNWIGMESAISAITETESQISSATSPRRSRREQGGRNIRKTQLKGGRRASSTIREV